MKIYSNTGDIRGVSSGGGGNSVNYQVDVSANGTVVLSNASLNFNNTATINISSSTNVGQANIAFTANTANIVGPVYAQANLANTTAQTGISLAISANTEAQSAWTLANTANTTANLAYGQANVANTTAQTGISLAISANNLANTANTTANLAYGQANVANTTAQTGISLAISANTEAQSAWTLANTANTTANLAYGQANVANTTAQTGISLAISANTEAQSAWTLANTANTTAQIAANTVAILANGTLVMSNANVNFNNSSSVNVAVTSNVSHNFANISFSVNTAAINVSSGVANVSSGNTSNIVISGNASNVIIDTRLASGGGVTLVDNVTSNSTTSAPTANILSYTYIVANSANSTAQSAIALAANAWMLANAAVANVSSGNTSNIVISGNASNVIIDSRFVGGGGGGNYQADIYANGTVVLANSNINFNNTATVNVSAIANGSHQTNIAFTVNTSAVGGTSANATTSIRGITLLVDSISSTDTANAATANAVSWSFNIANTSANAALSLAANAWMLANAAVANVSSGNTSNIVISGNASNVIIDSRFVGGGGGGNYQADVLAYGSLVLANANLNFINSTTTNTTVTANGTTQANISISINSAAITNVVSLNISSNIANVGNISITQNTNTGNLKVTTLANIATANIVGLLSTNTHTYANGTIIVASANNNFNNTASINVSTTANGTQANIAFTVIPASSNGQVQFNNNGILGATKAINYNVASNLTTFDANVMIANTNSLNFGGGGANTVANAQFTIVWNVTSSSLDFLAG